MAYRWLKIGELLAETGAIAPGQTEIILERMKTSGLRFGETGVELGFFEDEILAQALARQFGMDYVDLSSLDSDFAPPAGLPEDLVVRFGVVPLEYAGEDLVVATADPTDISRLNQLEWQIGGPVTLKIAGKSQIQRVAAGSRGTTGEALESTLEKFRGLANGRPREDKDLLLGETQEEAHSPVIKLIDTTLVDALQKRASDIHIESGPDGVVIKYRIDGVLSRAMEPLDRRFQGPVISRIKVMSELDISERRIPQDGRFKARIGGRSIDFRVSILPSSFGEDAVIRILDKSSIAVDLKGLTLESLGFNPREIARFRRQIRAPYGMVLVTGPTGSGKTTTLYAALAEIHTEQEKIITIEDPVEYQVPGVVQVPVNEKKGLTFARGLRSILRHDPDKIMVGEIRDAETAQIAVQSALTGHLVFTTVHANNVFDVLGRFLHMGLDPYHFLSSLNMVLAQRLVRKLCVHCKQPVTYSEDEMERFGLDPARHAGQAFYEGRGCKHCHGLGYAGRSAIVELLEINDELRELIINRAPTGRLRRAAAGMGTVFLRQAALEKVLQGVTSLPEIDRVTFADAEVPT
ncbi:ATPase, T2SS/T4P/T4SS family [Syntrophotalea acetylenica]|uniref:GspE/PulE family protein n=1 Tax=Syntrophotalea acetylenica TaxID=29542 RepID=UPI002A35D6FF|nr:ATPase, T2SS/T4P/T4SS family [Syntrophotalea acetylenica]MDY0262277.1 ATPase, T2SS/T4P/T4SS family [Syntrophotalea acetylenica]